MAGQRSSPCVLVRKCIVRKDGGSTTRAPVTYCTGFVAAKNAGQSTAMQPKIPAQCDPVSTPLADLLRTAVSPLHEARILLRAHLQVTSTVRPTRSTPPYHKGHPPDRRAISARSNPRPTLQRTDTAHNADIVFTRPGWMDTDVSVRRGHKTRNGYECTRSFCIVRVEVIMGRTLHHSHSYEEAFLMPF